MNEIRREFEAWMKSRSFRKRWSLYTVDVQRWDTWRAAYEAGEIAMREKAAAICDAGCEECTFRPNCHSLDAELVRALALSGAEESKKEK